MQVQVCQLYCTNLCCFPELISFKNSWSCNSSALASEILCIVHAALLWRQSRWVVSVLLGAGWIYPDVFLEGPGQGAPPLLQWASEVQSYGPVAPRVLYRTGWSKTALCRYQHIFGCFSKVLPKVYFLIPVVWLVLNLKPQSLCASQQPRKWLTRGL